MSPWHTSIGSAPPIHAGTSTCPACYRYWWVTPLDDCLLPSCGCYGQDTSANNPDRLCHSCGLAHALAHRQAETANTVREDGTDDRGPT